MAYKHLTFSDRLKIEAWQKVGTSPRVMAEKLGVHISTIYRELKRGQYEHLNSNYTTEQRYSPDIAEEKNQANLRAKGAPLKIGSDHEYAQYIEYKIRVEKYSPRAVLGEIKRQGVEFSTTISAPTLYRYIEQGVFLTITNDNLPVKRNKTEHRYKKVRAARAPKGTSIEKRPAEIAERSSFGHWEMDCVVGKKGTKKTFLVLTERYTRYEIIRIMKDHTAASVVKALDGIERSYGAGLFAKVFQTITIDNGSEFSDYEGLEQSCRKKGSRTKVYYCHPYSSYERGSNENLNKMIRRWLPKGTNFDEITEEVIAAVTDWINRYPRKILGYLTADQVFEAQLSAIFASN